MLASASPIGVYVPPAASSSCWSPRCMLVAQVWGAARFSCGCPAMVATRDRDYGAPGPRTRAQASPAGVARRLAAPSSDPQRLGRTRRMSTHPDVNYYRRAGTTGALEPVLDEPAALHSAAGPLPTQDRVNSSDAGRQQRRSPAVVPSADVSAESSAGALPQVEASAHVPDNDKCLPRPPPTPTAVGRGHAHMPAAPPPTGALQTRHVGEAGSLQQPSLAPSVTRTAGVADAAVRAVVAHEEHKTGHGQHRDHQSASAVRTIAAHAVGVVGASSSTGADPSRAPSVERRPPSASAPPVVSQAHDRGPAVQLPADVFESGRPLDDLVPGVGDRYPRVASDWYTTVRRRHRKNPHPRHIPPGSRSRAARHAGAWADTSSSLADDHALQGGRETADDRFEAVRPVRGVQASGVPHAVRVALPRSDTTSDEDDTSPVCAQEATKNAVSGVVHDEDATSTAPGKSTPTCDDQHVRSCAVMPAFESKTSAGTAQDKNELSLVAVQPDPVWPGACLVELPPACSATVPVQMGRSLSLARLPSVPRMPTLPGPSGPQQDEPPTQRHGAAPSAAPAAGTEQRDGVALKWQSKAPTLPVVKSEPVASSAFASEAEALPPAPLEIKLEPPWPLPRAVKLEPSSAVRVPTALRGCVPHVEPSARNSAVDRTRFSASQRPLLQLARTTSLSGHGDNGVQASVHRGSGGRPIDRNTMAPVQEGLHGRPSESTPSETVLEAGDVPDGDASPRVRNAGRLEERNDRTGATAHDQDALGSRCRPREGGAPDPAKR